jgi:hypothetical protein
MAVMDRVRSLRSSAAERFSGVWASLTLDNAKALPGKFVASVVAVVSAIVNFFVVTPSTWVWSKVPAGPQPSLWSRVSSFFFKPATPAAPAPVVVPQAEHQAALNKNVELTKENDKLKEEVGAEKEKVAAKDVLLTAVTKERDEALEREKNLQATLDEKAGNPMTTAANNAAAKAKKKNVVSRGFSNVASLVPNVSFSKKKHGMQE